MERKIKIALAEDQHLMRKALIAYIGDYDSFECVGEAANGRELLDLLKNTETDIVLLDIKMPVMDGFEALRLMRIRFPDVKAIILSMHDDLKNIEDSLALGAKGYLSKDCIEKQFEKTILKVYESGFFMEREVIQKLLYLQTLTKPDALPEIVPFLTEREFQVLKELCKGKTDSEIADFLKLSKNTVHFHRVNLYKKTESHNLADLIKYSINKGIISLSK